MSRLLTMVCGMTLLLSSGAAMAQDVVLTEDSKPQPGVPQGEVRGPFEWKSEIFPGTVRKYWLYIPKQYDETKKTCLFVLQDGYGVAKNWQVMPVLDNLIHKQEIPVQIGLFIEPGVVPAPHDKAQPRFNRSLEYDSLGDRYARFLIDEILPEVKKSYNISDDPNDRAIGGSSSGAICAFNVAWERPDQFRRVFSSIGTFVGLRGADAFPVLIRKCEPKPLRVYLEDGSNDLNIYAGDWFVANHDMLSALKYSGYSVQNNWGTGGHNGKHASEVLPEGLRFLWKDYPQPITAPAPQKGRIDALIPGEDWQLVSSGHKYTEGPAVNAQGEVFFSDIPDGKIHKIALDGAVSIFAQELKSPSGMMFAPDGKLYVCEKGTQKIIRFTPDAEREVVVEGIVANDLVLLANGTGYCTDTENKNVWWFNSTGEKKIIDNGIERPNGVILSPDQTLLTVADSVGRMTYSFQIQPDGSLAFKQTYGWLHLADDAPRSGADGMTVDTLGNLYVCTKVGLQVLDQPGRVNLIINRPHPGALSNVVFGGQDLKTLYVTAGGKVFKRQVNTQGVSPFKGPVMPPKPGL